MFYSVFETLEAFHDLEGMAEYMAGNLKNPDAAIRFLNRYEEKVNILKQFPSGYHGIGLKYRGYEIKLMSFSTYNIFFIVDVEEFQVMILRVLKNLQDWKRMLRIQKDYHFRS